MNGVLENNIKLKKIGADIKLPKDVREWKFVWRNVIFFSANHIASLYAVYLMFTQAMWPTIIFAFYLGTISTIGVTAGAHRLWAHKAYKAKLPLKILNLLMFTIAYQGSVHQWVRDHRVHHKFCDTDADPHNSTRGFFFSHVGWLLLKKHPEVINKGRTVDMTDIKADPLLRVHHQYYSFWVFIFCYVVPAYIPLLWYEHFWTSFFVAVIFRHTYALNTIFLVNSAAHMWGTRPYNKSILPAENRVVSLFATGEGFHNYHHTFPWDYRTAELGGYMFNTSRLFIDIMAKIGWAYDLKTVSEKYIQTRATRTGDGSHPVWGWDDKDLSHHDKELTKILNTAA